MPRQCPDSALTVADSEPDSADSARQSDSQGSKTPCAEMVQILIPEARYEAAAPMLQPFGPWIADVGLPWRRRGPV